MRILFLGPQKSTFVKNDYEILSKQNNSILPIDTCIGGGIIGIKNLLKCTIKSIYGVFKSDVVFSWFADYTSLIPVLLAKLLRKRSVVVAGGFDVGHQPQLNYGAIMRPIRWFCVRNSFLMADDIIAVSEYAKSALLRLTETNPQKITVIHNCIKSTDYPIEDINIAERQHFITISQSHSVSELILKGGDAFIEAARNNPDYQFIFAGLRGKALDKAKEWGNGLENLEIIPGPLDLYRDILPLYKTAYAYMQLSIEESFGVAVVEAMKCGCVPIVSPNAALPEVAGEYAVIVSNNQEIDQAIKNGTIIDNNKRIEISIFADKYDIAYREIKVLRLLSK